MQNQMKSVYYLLLIRVYISPLIVLFRVFRLRLIDMV